MDQHQHQQQQQHSSQTIIHELCNLCLQHQESVRMWMLHLAQHHPLPSEWLSDKAKTLNDVENAKPYTIVTDSRKRRRKPTTPRPLNTFMIFSRHIRRNILFVFPDASNSQLSKELGVIWKKMSQEVKSKYEEESKRLARLHQLEFPDYKYQPKKRNCRRHDSRLLYEEGGMIRGGNGLVRGDSSMMSGSGLGIENSAGGIKSPNSCSSSGGGGSGLGGCGNGIGGHHGFGDNSRKDPHSNESSDGENKYIRYSIFNKNMVKKECQSFGNSSSSNGNCSGKVIFSTTGGVGLNVNTSNILSSLSSAPLSIIKKENMLDKPLILHQQHPINKPLNVRITNVDSPSSVIIRPRLATSNVLFIPHETTTTTTNLLNNCINGGNSSNQVTNTSSLLQSYNNNSNNNKHYHINNNHHHHQLNSIITSITTAQPQHLSQHHSTATTPKTELLSIDSINCDDVHSASNSNPNTFITNINTNNSTSSSSGNQFKDVCLIYPPDQNLDEDIDITGNIFNNEYEMDWPDLDESFRNDLPALNSLFHH